jgi:hypothetical protein
MRKPRNKPQRWPRNARPARGRRVTVRDVLLNYAGGTLRGLGGLGDAGGILTPAQIRYYAQNAGFSGSDLDTAVAIAMAESSGNSRIYNPETAAAGGTPQGQGSYGLWQIYLKEHPEFAGQDLYDPQINANAAYSVYSRAGGFTAWTTFNSGAYQKYLGTSAPAPSVITIDPATGNPVSPIAEPPPPSSSPVSSSQILILTASAIAAYLAAELFFD